MGDSDDNINYWQEYSPSKPAALAGTVIFGILTLAHIVRVVRTRRWFAICTVLGGLFEFVGLAARAYCHDHQHAKNAFIIQLLLILLAPILFAAAVYMFLGRLIRAASHTELALVRVNWTSKIFVAGDILCFLVQAAGASKIVGSDDPDEIQIGSNIVLAGLGLQVAIFGFFVLCAVVFHIRVHRGGHKKTINPGVHLDMMLLSLYLCSVLVTVRNIFRLAEYQQGPKGYLQTTEWPQYGLDVILMGLVMIVSMAWYHASMQDRKIDPMMSMEHLSSSSNENHPQQYGNSAPYPPAQYAQQHQYSQPAGYGQQQQQAPQYGYGQNQYNGAQSYGV